MYRRTLAASALAVVALITSACSPWTGDGAGPPAASGTALAAVDTLTVKGRAPKTGYDRDVFGRGWVDVDRNGCGTREDILKRDLTGVRYADGHCKVASGTLADDPYTGTDVPYVRGRSKVDIDHVVALSDAWQKGAQQWSAETRRRFANDPLNLLAVDAATNRRKSDGDAATWLPPNGAYRCAYVARQVAVKRKYEVWITEGERDAMKRVLRECPQQKLPQEGDPAGGPAGKP
ncbi:HNH endonuclease family protein [Streptomyces bikiniensis]|uniref:HNH endonuclease family protein n=1 Tax=Streptomyces bikiniensis TaxID=1896 RepID=UPI0004C1EDD6|nr:HNH endonuclease family protein [Streptomyces bikiniensis]